MKRSHQVEALNVSRKQVRNLEEQWRQMVNREIENKDRTIEEVMMRIEDGEEELEGLQDRYHSMAAQLRTGSHLLNQSANASAADDGPKVTNEEECQSQVP